MTTGPGEGDAWNAGPGLFQPRVEVRAWRVTRGNVARVAEWCGGHVIRDRRFGQPEEPAYVVVRRRTRVPCAPGDYGEDAASVTLGDWVVRDPEGGFFVLGDAAFRAAYRVGVVDHVAEECG